VARHLGFARNLRIETHVMDGKDIALTIAQFARAQHVTQIFMRRSRPPAWGQWLRSSTLHRVVHLTRDMEVTIVADRRRKCAVPARHP
jgi:K+-sensing histidine kinase KdpD